MIGNIIDVVAVLLIHIERNQVGIIRPRSNLTIPLSQLYPRKDNSHMSSVRIYKLTVPFSQLYQRKENYPHISVSESLISSSMHCFIYLTNRSRGHRCMVIGLATVFVITAFVITAYHYWSSEFKFRSWRGVLDTTLCDKVCQWLATGWCVFSAYMLLLCYWFTMVILT
jgi:hypothetical protein